MHYQERVRPLRSVREIVSAALRRTPAFTATTIGPPEPLRTGEGEVGCLVAMSGLVDGRPTDRVLAIVIGDDFASVLDAEAHRGAVEHWQALVRTVASEITLSLKPGQRRFGYPTPRGWRPALHGYVTSWRHQSEQALLVVLPATPRYGTTREWLVALRHDQEAKGIATVRTPVRVDVIAPKGLRGAAWQLAVRTRRGTLLERELVVLQDASLTYVLRLDAREDYVRCAREVLRDVIGGIVPVAHLPPLECAALACWAE